MWLFSRSTKNAIGSIAGSSRVVNGERTFKTVHASATASAEQLAAAEAILRSVRHAPTGAHPQRLAFELPGGWDSG